MKNLKQNLTAFLILFNLFSQAQDIKNGQIVKNINGLNIIIDKRIEMLSVIQYLAESKMVKMDKITYAENISKYFDQYKNHKVVSLYKEMEMRGFVYDAPVHTMLFLDTDFKKVKEIEKPLIQRASGKKKLNEFILQLQDFNTKTNFDKFFSENYTILNKSIELLVDSSLKNFDEIRTIEEFYGYKQNSYNFVLSALVRGGYGPRMDAGNDLYDIYDIQGAWAGAINKIPYYGNEQLIKYIVWHEFGHSFVNPLVDMYYKEFKKYEKLKKPIFSTMQSQAYGTWGTILAEHILRAVTTTLVYEKYGKEVAESELDNEKASGFIYIDSLYSKILNYSQNKKGTNFKDFFPKLIDVMQVYSKNPIKFKSIPVPNTLFSLNDFILIYPTHETSDSLNSVIKKYVESVNEMFYKLPDEKVIPDTIAVKRNLKEFTIICYGSYKGNLWLKNKIKNLPFQIQEDKIITKDSINQRNLSLIASWLNPDNPEKYLVIYTSQKSEQIININGVFHGSNNYVIADSKFVIIEKGNYKFLNGKYILK